MTHRPSDFGRVPVEALSQRYDIVIGSGILGDPGAGLLLQRDGAAFIVSDANVAPLYADRLVRLLSDHGHRTESVILPAGEESKEWPTLQRLLDAMFAASCDRETVVYALGGGVVGDIAGFAAACFMRGIRYVQVPTTLLAQVDSSVGGKTGINHLRGKNLIGAFHQPSQVLVDIETLRSLPQRQLIAGLAEIIKYGAACDAAFFDWIEASLPALLARDDRTLASAIRRSCEIKARIVGADERESGERAILNFGHTFAHALEAALGFGHWLHGEAVGCGMVMAAALSVRTGSLDPASALRIERLVDKAGLPTRAPRLDEARLVDLMKGDKKALDGRMRFVLLNGIGRSQVQVVTEAEIATLLAALRS